MNNRHRLFKESILWVLIFLPYIYLVIIWQTLPDRVPIHFNEDGNPNGWAGKTFLLYMPAALGIVIYLLLLLVPIIDPKKRIQDMGNKYYKIRLTLTFFFSLLVTLILNSSKVGVLKTQNVLIMLLGILFAILGWYFKTIPPNYFIGIRTPWTLESERVWKKTHAISRPLWVAGGGLAVLLSFVITDKHALMITCGILLAIMVSVPIMFSYIEFKREIK